MLYIWLCVTIVMGKSHLSIICNHLGKVTMTFMLCVTISIDDILCFMILIYFVNLVIVCHCHHQCIRITYTIAVVSYVYGVLCQDLMSDVIIHNDGSIM